MRDLLDLVQDARATLPIGLVVGALEDLAGAPLQEAELRRDGAPLERQLGEERLAAICGALEVPLSDVLRSVSDEVALVELAESAPATSAPAADRRSTPFVEQAVVPAPVQGPRVFAA